MIRPQGILTEYVRFFWSLEAEVGSGDPFLHRALPDNCVELIFYCKGKLSISSATGPEGDTFTSGVYGQAQIYRQFKTNADFSLFGVYLYPYAFRHLFNLPAYVLNNEKVDSKTLWGAEGQILEEKVMLAQSAGKRAELVSGFLLNRIRSVRNNDKAFLRQIKSVTDNNTLLSVTSFAHDCNLSRRQFERKFTELSGFSPKEFLNIVRFRNVLKEMAQNNKSLAQIAMSADYYDQSHLSNEFRKLTGYTPREFFVNHQTETDLRATRDFKN